MKAIVTNISLARSFVAGRRKTAVFALLSTCNCKCLMCDMWRLGNQRIGLNEAKRVLNFLYDLGFLTVYFTGGEPTLHPNLMEIVEYANRLGMVTSTTTNGTSSEKVISGLKKAGLHLLSVSLDHWDSSICEEIRGFREIKKKEEKIISFAKDIGLKVYALTFLNPYVARDGVEHLVEYVNGRLKIPFGFCYPAKCDFNSYRLGGRISSKEIKEYVDEAVKTILKLKRMRRYEVANPYLYIEDLVRFSRNEVPNYYCKGGEEVVYIDWKGNVYPCFLKPKLFSILAGDEPRFLRDVACNECFINCFREPSLLSQALRSPKLALKELQYSWSSTIKLVLPSHMIQYPLS